MPLEKEILPIEFKECPICRCPDTVCQLVGEEEKQAGKAQKDAFFSMEKIITPLNNPALVGVGTGLLCHYDICAKCGFRYCTRVDKVMCAPPPIPNFRK